MGKPQPGLRRSSTWRSPGVIELWRSLNSRSSQRETAYRVVLYSRCISHSHRVRAPRDDVLALPGRPSKVGRASVEVLRSRQDPEKRLKFSSVYWNRKYSTPRKAIGNVPPSGRFFEGAIRRIPRSLRSNKDRCQNMALSVAVDRFSQTRVCPASTASILMNRPRRQRRIGIAVALIVGK